MRLTVKLFGGIMFTMTFLVTIACADTMVCYYPSRCKTIVGTEYSTGGTGNRGIHYIELDCYTHDGQYIKYFDKIFKTSALFGFGRIALPDKIIFKPWDKDELQCK